MSAENVSTKATSPLKELFPRR